MSNTQMAVVTPTSAFASIDAFENAQRMAVALAKSTIVPKEFQGNPANTLIALEYANRIGESPIIVMQNLNVINGRPGMKAEYLISRINTCGRFSEELQFEYKGTKGADDRECTAWTIKRGKRIEGTTVSIKMAKEEGWFGRQGSKWRTMPEQMLAYRAASFFQRLHAPDLSFGMQTVEEVIDIEAVEVKTTPTAVSSLNEKLRSGPTEKAGDKPVTVNKEVTNNPKESTPQETEKTPSAGSADAKPESEATTKTNASNEELV